MIRKLSLQTQLILLLALVLALLAVAFAVVQTLGERETVDQAALLASMLVAAGIGFFLWLRRSVTRPLARVIEGAQRYSLGELGYEIDLKGSPELRDLAETLNTMARQLRHSREELIGLYREMETRVMDRTRDLQMSAEIGRIAASLRDVDALMRETVEQIRRRFDVIYHAQIFLLDNLRERAVLVESAGEAGEQLLASGHSLAVGSESVIGQVTERGQTVIVSDTRKADARWLPNSFLPDTRAEMALPLLIEGRVIGALDVQSLQPDVFTEEMVRVFEVLAVQLAIAIENARLLTESQRRLQEIDSLNRQLTRTAWQDFVGEQAGQSPLGYVYDQVQTASLAADDWPELAANRAEAAIQVQGETVGTLIAALDEDDTLPQDDRLLVEAVAERVALAVESARLFQQTQRALAETERLYETARMVSSAPDLDAIYHLIADQLSAIASIDHIEILLAGPDPALAQYLESVYAWRRRVAAARQEASERARVVPLTHAWHETLPRSAPLVVADMAQDLPADYPLRPKFNSLNARSVLLTPLTAGGRWFGLLLCSSQQPGGFEASSVTFASALADQLAIAIENRRLFEEAQTEARRARALAEAGQLASQIGGDFETGLANLFQAVAGPGNYDRWWFGLLSDDGAHLRQVTAYGIESVETVDVADDTNSLAEAARIGEIVLVNDPGDHSVMDEQDPAIARMWGKRMAMPVKIGTAMVGVLLIGRDLSGQNLDERDIQLVATLASQVAVATQNQRLFAEAESQRQNLQTIVDTMPTGILVIDKTGQVLLSNRNLRDLLGPEMRAGGSERPLPYPIVVTGTDTPYPREEWPWSRVFRTGQPVLVDDMTIAHPDGYEINVLAQAAPITDQSGAVTAVVGAFQDITELQQLERALQNSLRETTMLYEASRSISRATGMDELLDAIVWQCNLLAHDRIAILLRDFDRSDALAFIPAISQPAETMSDEDREAVARLVSHEAVIARRDDAPAEVAAYLDRAALTTIGCFPLMVREQPNGWILVGFGRGQEITTEQRRFLATLADQAAISIENQRLFTRTEAALRETATLYHASRALADAESPLDILGAIVNFATTRLVGGAALYALLGEAERTSYAAVERLAILGHIPQEVDSGGARYPADQFPFWEAALGSEVIYAEDVAHLPFLDEPGRRALVDSGVRSATLIPLRVGERPLGVIFIGFEDRIPRDPDTIRVYETLADQAVIALENTRLYQQAQRRARLLGTAAEITRAVTSILRLDDLLPQVVNQIRDAFGYDHAQVFLIDEDGQDARLVASTGEAGRKLLELMHSLPVGSQSVIGRVTATGQPQIALDTADARVIHRPNPLLPNTRSEMALPLIARGQILGALDVQSNQSGAFTDEDARILASLADMVATAIDNARLFELSEQRAEEMTFLFNVTTAAAASPNLEDALEQAVATLRETMNVASASIYLPDESGERLMRGADVGVSTPETEQAVIVMNHGVIGWVARHEEAVIIDDIAQDARRLPGDESPRAMMAVPLLTGGELVGVLAVESSRARAFDQDGLRLLRTLSGSLAAIIQNSRLLREVQAANERLLEVDQLKTNFLAAMSHELRTPLNSIIGFSRVILKGIDGPLTEMQEQDLNTIYESGKHLLGLVNDILDQAKIGAGKMDLTFGFYKLQDVINGVMSSAIGLTRDKPIRLRTEIADTLPDAYGDEFRTRQVLLNLVSNAAKFTNQGSITVSAFPVVEDGQQRIQVSVSDTGIGIAQKDMRLLFEPFQQIDSSLTRTVGGTGMGLPLAKTLTELQHGRIWVESEPGVGSTFSITLPTAPLPVGETGEAAAPPTEPAPESSPSARLAAPAPKRKMVLVLEEDVEVIHLYRRYLSREGYEVVGITRPEDLPSITVNELPHLILLDVNLRDQAGWGVLEQLKSAEHTREVPVIVCSLNPDRARGLEMGAAVYLVRPFSENQLLDTIREIDAEVSHQRILLVDDKPETMRPFREALEEFGQYDIIEATSGQQAIDVIQQPGRIDLVILDLRMPEIDGFEVLQMLRATDRTASIPVLVLTAEEVTAEERAALASIDVYRKDALDEEALLDRVEAQLGTTRESD